MASEGNITIAQYLLLRLKELGIDEAFGVPGDYVLGFMNEMVKLKDEKSKIQLINTCNELNAAYAADGYARVKGYGCLITTYGVGELSAINGVAGSFAELVPVVAITGCPSTKDLQKQPLLHHTIGDYSKTKRMFEMISCASTLLDNPEKAPEEIDRVLKEMINHQKPIYIALPADMVNKKCKRPSGLLECPYVISDKNSLEEALKEAMEMLEKAQKPVVVADVELFRYHLKKEFQNLIEKSGLPFATLMMGKTILDEEHPQFIGLYQGKSSREYVRNRIETADCILQLGVLKSDLNTAHFTTKLSEKKSICLNHDKLQIKNHFYQNINMKDFIDGLAERLKKRDRESLDIKSAVEGCVHRKSLEFQVKLEDKLTLQRIFDRVAHFIPENSIIIADTGVSLWAAAETLMPKGTQFIGQIFYGSIGYSVGATLGACFAAPDRPVILFVGDGSFQETAQDISTIIRYRRHPTIFLLNNDGYSIERAIIDGPFNDIQPWKYHKLPEVFGGSPGVDVHTEGQLEVALHHIQESKHKILRLIELHTARMDFSSPLKAAGQAMAAENEILPMASQ